MDKSVIHIKYDKIEKPCDLFVADMPLGYYGWAMCKGFVHSDQREFYKFVSKFSDIYLRGFLIDYISSFLVLHHKDLSADVYVNNLPLKIKIMPKSALCSGEAVMSKDIADIDELIFDGIEIKEDDCIAFCFKKGWKFGLYFDLLPDGKKSFLNLDDLYHELGKHYKYLMFQETYAVLENESQFSQMFADGWFPFIQLLAGEFEQLVIFYKDKDKFASSINAFLNSFDEKRIMSFVNNWWRNPIFKEKQQIVESGIKSYLQSNYIGSIKTLYSEIEGIIRIGYTRELKKTKISFTDLKQYVHQKAKEKFVSLDSLGFPDVFFRYIDEVIFKDFNLQTGDVDLSRHSTLHGVANAKDYTKEKALQAILTLDQMYHYLT